MMAAGSAIGVVVLVVDEVAGFVIGVVEGGIGDSDVAVGLDEVVGWDRGRRVVGDGEHEAVAGEVVVVLVVVVDGLVAGGSRGEVRLVGGEGGIGLVCQYWGGDELVLHFGVDFVSVLAVALDAVVVDFAPVPVVARDAAVVDFALVSAPASDTPAVGPVSTAA